MIKARPLRAPAGASVLRICARRGFLPDRTSPTSSFIGRLLIWLQHPTPSIDMCAPLHPGVGGAAAFNAITNVFHVPLLDEIV